MFPLNRLSFVLPANILLQYQVWLNLQTNMIENLGQFEGFICVYPTTMRQIRCMLHISEFCNVTIFVVLAVLWRVSAPCECLQSVGDIPARHSHHSTRALLSVITRLRVCNILPSTLTFYTAVTCAAVNLCCSHPVFPAVTLYWEADHHCSEE